MIISEKEVCTLIQLLPHTSKYIEEDNLEALIEAIDDAVIDDIVSHNDEPSDFGRLLEKIRDALFHNNYEKYENNPDSTNDKITIGKNLYKWVECYDLPPCGNFRRKEKYRWEYCIDAVAVWDDMGEEIVFKEYIFMWYFRKIV